MRCITVRTCCFSVLERLWWWLNRLARVELSPVLQRLKPFRVIWNHCYVEEFAFVLLMWSLDLKQLKCITDKDNEPFDLCCKEDSIADGTGSGLTQWIDCPFLEKGKENGCFTVIRQRIPAFPQQDADRDCDLLHSIELAVWIAVTFLALHCCFLCFTSSPGEMGWCHFYRVLFGDGEIAKRMHSTTLH